MFVNTYDFTLEKGDESVDVSLRLGSGQQIRLKKKWNNEGTTETLFKAVDDIERFVDILDFSLKYKGNTNKIKSGEDLFDLMAENDMLGMAKKQKIITALGRASGIFDEDERELIDKQSQRVIGDALDTEKNA